MRTTIHKISIDEVEKLAFLAREIWEEHYGSIFGVEQTNNLIDKLQNIETITNEINSGYVYYFVKLQNRIVGYCNFIEINDELYCGKLYLLKNMRGLGIGKEVFVALEKEAILLGKKDIRLSVNSSSERSIRFYTTQGMRIEKTETNILPGEITSVDVIMHKSVCPIEKSIKYFFQGYNCCQAIVMGFAPFLDIKAEHIITLGLAFGGGFARTRHVCGAMSGIGMYVSHLQGNTSPESKDTVYAVTQELCEKFKEVNHSFICSEILENVDNITTTPKSDARTAQYYQERPCAKVIENASKLLLEHLQKLKSQNKI
ncbi:MAG: C-GCAxxG-C-C family (seleno)protein [Bacillota bacterium]